VYDIAQHEWTDEYSDTDMREIWANALPWTIARDPKCCVVVKCDEARALTLSRKFLGRCRVPGAVHFDGQTLSLECSWKGWRAADLMREVNGWCKESIPPPAADQPPLEPQP
jgi:hypothetical protein